MRHIVSVILGVFKAMAAREGGPLGAAYRRLHQAMAALLYQEGPLEAYIRDLEALLGEGRTRRANRVLQALEDLGRVSPADATVAKVLVRQLAQSELFFANNAYLYDLEEVKGG
jgi:hypothetical protein